MFGAALATSISYFMCFLLFCGFLCTKRIKTESKTFYITPTHNKRDYRTEFCDFFKTRRSEYFSNHTQSYFVLYGGEHRRLRIISRMLMFALFLFSESHKGLFQLLVIITELKIMKGSRKVSKFLSNMQRC
jgi:hypothetical protein